MNGKNCRYIYTKIRNVGKKADALTLKCMVMVLKIINIFTYEYAIFCVVMFEKTINVLSIDSQISYISTSDRRYEVT